MMLCGCIEECFKDGEQWGHFSGILCAHLIEDVCQKTGQKVNVYTTEQEYERLKNKVAKYEPNSDI